MFSYVRFPKHRPMTMTSRPKLDINTRHHQLFRCLRSSAFFAVTRASKITIYCSQHTTSRVGKSKVEAWPKSAKMNDHTPNSWLQPHYTHLCYYCVCLLCFIAAGLLEMVVLWPQQHQQDLLLLVGRRTTEPPCFFFRHAAWRMTCERDSLFKKSSKMTLTPGGESHTADEAFCCSLVLVHLTQKWSCTWLRFSPFNMPYYGGGLFSCTDVWPL